MSTTTTTESGTTPAEVETFVARLERADRGALSRLKRNSGQSLAESRGALPLFYRLLPGTVRTRDYETYFLIATLFPFAPRQGQGDLGRAMLGIARAPAVNREGVDRRMAVLLDSHRGEIPFRLRQAVRLIASHERPIDWRKLLTDLLRWDHPSRPVQKSWARSYFGESA